MRKKFSPTTKPSRTDMIARPERADTKGVGPNEYGRYTPVRITAVMS